MHRTRSPGAASRSRTARAAAASRTCSQLSRITSAEESLNDSNSAVSPPGPSTAPTNTSMTWSGVLALSSLANQTPSSPTPAAEVTSRPTSIATAVFPTPPGPTTSTNRSRVSRSVMAATSSSRPTSSDDIEGRFPARRRVRAGRTGTSSAASWTRIRCSSSCSWGRGSSPSSAESCVLTFWYDANASAWRPARYWAVISSSQRLSWNGWTATAASSSPITSPTSPEPQSRPELDLQERHPGLFEARPVWGDPFAVAGGLQDVAAVQAQRRGAQLDGSGVVPGFEQPRCNGRCAQRGERVDVGRFYGERVATVAADDRGRVAECPTQHRDLRLQRVTTGADSLRCPEVLDERVGPDELTRLQG